MDILKGLFGVRRPSIPREELVEQSLETLVIMKAQTMQQQAETQQHLRSLRARLKQIKADGIKIADPAFFQRYALVKARFVKQEKFLLLIETAVDTINQANEALLTADAVKTIIRSMQSIDLEKLSAESEKESLRLIELTDEVRMTQDTLEKGLTFQQIPMSQRDMDNVLAELEDDDGDSTTVPTVSGHLVATAAVPSSSSSSPAQRDATKGKKREKVAADPMS